MNKTIFAYADLDSIYDPRRAIIQKFLMQDVPFPADNASEEEFMKYTQEGDKRWEAKIEANYIARRMDTFEYPSVGLNKEKFYALYNARSIKDWSTGWFYPTCFMSRFLKLVIDAEQLTEVPISISTIQLTINTFPYDFPEDMIQSLKEHCHERFGGRVEVKTTFVDTSKLTVLYYKQFAYVFKYDLFLVPDYKAFFESVGSPPIPDTTFLLPDILVEENEHFEGDIGERIFSVGLGFAHVLRTVPVAHLFYDYEKQ